MLQEEEKREAEHKAQQDMNDEKALRMSLEEETQESFVANINDRGEIEFRLGYNEAEDNCMSMGVEHLYLMLVSFMWIEQVIHVEQLKHNTPNNSDHDDDIHDFVTRISKLDISDPLHLHPNDTTALTVVSIKLKGTKNYQVWLCAMLLALECKNKIAFINGSCKRSNEDEVLGKQWDRVNAIVLGWILNSISVELFLGFKKHNQLLKLMQFLMGLDDSYMEIRSFILSREILSDVRSAYATISSEESHKVAVGSIAGSSQRNQAFAFVSNVPYSHDFQRRTNQHMTYTDKELDNVIDISHLKIKVGHHNGTEAYIFKIGNLRLSNGLTLYDDLNLKNVLRIGEQCEGLLGHPANPILNVLKDSLNIDKKDNTICCEISQKAKQTRESFPLSDHKSKSLGDLVHLDLWRPYKVTSSEGFRFFLTVVDDYTRAVWIPNDDERVANDMNKGKSVSSNSSESGSNIIAANFLVDSKNDADSSNDFVTTQNEEVATLEENVFSEGNLDQNPSSPQGVQNVRRSSRQIVFPKNYNDFVVESKFKASKYSHWIDAMNQEMYSLLRNGTWELVDLPEGRKAIGSTWIYKIKFRSSDEIDRYKARLVAQGFRQKEGIDYEETFSPLVKMVTVRYEIVYMRPSEGYFPSDDIIITDNNVDEIKKFEVFLKSKFMIKDLGKLKYFLGIEVVDTKKGIRLNQRKYVLDLLSEYGMLACKPVDTPLLSKLVISNEATKSDPVLKNITDYQKLMGKLIYLTNTRPDISYVVHCLSQFMHSPLKSHLKTTLKN
nr:hypothetical protein [Tanacetum cinerariifolium]